MIQSMAAIAEGKGFGAGLGNELFKFGYLPEDTNDFLFAIICEGSGSPGGADRGPDAHHALVRRPNRRP